MLFGCKGEKKDEMFSVTMSCRLKGLKQCCRSCVRAASVWLILVFISERWVTFPGTKDFGELKYSASQKKCGLLPEQEGGGCYIISLSQNIQKWYFWALAALAKLATVIKDPFFVLFFILFIYFLGASKPTLVFCKFCENGKSLFKCS